MNAVSIWFDKWNIYSDVSVWQKSDMGCQSQHDLKCTLKFRPAVFSFLKPHAHDLTRIDHHLCLSASDCFPPYQFNHNQLLFQAKLCHIVLWYPNVLISDIIVIIRGNSEVVKFTTNWSVSLIIHPNRCILYVCAYVLCWLVQINWRMRGREGVVLMKSNVFSYGRFYITSIALLINSEYTQLT